MINAIQELVSLIERKKISKIRIINPSKKSESNKRYFELYKSIQSKKVTNNKVASTLLGYSSEKDKGFLMAMGRFRESLLNLFLFLDERYSYPNEFVINHAKSIRLLMLGKLLGLANAKKVALILLRKAIKISMKYEYVSVLNDSMLEYINISSRIQGDNYLKEYLKIYPDINERCKSVEDLELQMSIVTNLINLKNTFNQERENQLRKSLLIINSNDNKWGDIRIEEIKYLANVYLYQMENNYESLIKQSLVFKKFIIHSQKSRAKHHRLCAYNLMLGYLATKSYKKGQSLFEESKNLYSRKSASYIYFSEFYFLLCMHTQQYETAWELSTEIYENNSLSLVPSLRRERWRIFKPFILFSLKRKSNTKINTSKNQYKWLRTENFLDEKPIHSKDKEGLNTQIIIGQILMLLDEKKYDAIIDKTNALKAYSHRYIKRKEDKGQMRTYHFIRLLINMSNCAFDKKKIIESSEKDLSLLKEKKTNFTDLDKTLEVIPYENLWNLILDLFHNSRL